MTGQVYEESHDEGSGGRRDQAEERGGRHESTSDKEGRPVPSGRARRLGFPVAAKIHKFFAPPPNWDTGNCFLGKKFLACSPRPDGGVLLSVSFVAPPIL